jgi:hypothetical protein
MKKNSINYVILLLLIVFLNGCKNDQSESLELLNPKVEIKPYFGDIEFNWNSTSELESHLTISRYSEFQILIVDTLVNGNSYTLNQTYAPNSVYYWKIDNGLTEKESHFFIENILNKYEGSIQVMAKKRSLNLNPNQGWDIDTSYQSTLYIEIVNGLIHLKETTSSLNHNLIFHSEYSQWDTNNLYYEYVNENQPHEHNNLELFLEQDSVELQRVKYGLSFSSDLIFTFKGIIE